jgi:hypothetical protein
MIEGCSLPCGWRSGASVSGTPYYEDGSEVNLKKECPLKTLFSTGDG